MAVGASGTSGAGGRRRYLRRGLWLCLGLIVLVAWRVETPWRRAQAAYFDRVLETSRAELAVRRAELGDDLRFLEGEVEVARDELPRGAVAEAEQRLLALERKLRRAEEKDPSGREAEGFRELVENERRTLGELRAAVTEAERELAAARQPIERLEERVDSLDGFLGRLRGVPVLRALGAGVGLRSIQPTGTSRPERCVTCHLGMSSRASWSAVQSEGGPERWSRLWAPHPSPDLFLHGDSDHPVDAVGCVACHGGDGLATEFSAAGHRPRDEETELRWRREWGWRAAAPSQAPKPILAGARVESSCASCHDAPWLPGAPTLEAGRLLARSMGCAACHETGRGDLASAAPSLKDLPVRKRREWARTFLADPSAWKPTFMPHFWDGVPEAKRDAEVAAVVDWLWSGTERSRAERSGIEESGIPAGAAVVEGDDGSARSEGRRLWRDLGCGACHLVEPARREALLGSQRLRGPSLAALGSEASRDAIVLALESHRPAFGWRGGEVQALTSFLAGRVAPGRSHPDDTAEPDEPNSGVRDELLRARLLEVTTHEDAAAWIDRLDDARRTLLLGFLAVRRYRCRSCHLLPEPPSLGFDSLAVEDLETAPSLETVGERYAGPRAAAWPEEDDSGWPHSDSPPPRDVGLPIWRLSPKEAEALAVQLAGWRTMEVPGGAVHRGHEPAAAGRDAVARHGCRACHRLEAARPEAGGQAADAGAVDFFAGRTEAPPSLVGAGRKLRAAWIFRHLEDPSETAQRPWSALRMPRFDLSDDERSAIAEFFAVRAGVPIFSARAEALTSDSRTPDRRTLEQRPPEQRMGEQRTPETRALGEAVFQVLICDGCHGPEAPVRAPSYGDSGRRLRPEWLRRWLLEPPASAGMPRPFPPRAGRPDATYLLATLDAPMFSVQRSRLERFFVGREDLEAAFQDAEVVADALALHVLTLGE